MITIIGATATGKTSLSVNLAYLIDAQIISADSRQVYREMNIGTGKDLNEYKLKDKKIQAHLIDIVNPGYEYNVFEYQQDFFKIYQKLKDEKIKTILCGGSGLYIEAVLEGYKIPKVPPNYKLRHQLEQKEHQELILMLKDIKSNLHNKSDFESKKRTIRALEIEYYVKNNKPKELNFPKIEPQIFGIKFQRNELRKRITQRLNQRIDEGMIEEVENLIEKGISSEKLKYYGLEYKFIAYYLNNEISFAELKEKLNLAIRQFAKRQETWFRRMEKKGFQIHWIDGRLSMKTKIDIILEKIKI